MTDCAGGRCAGPFWEAAPRACPALPSIIRARDVFSLPRPAHSPRGRSRKAARATAPQRFGEQWGPASKNTRTPGPLHTRTLLYPAAPAPAAAAAPTCALRLAHWVVAVLVPVVGHPQRAAADEEVQQALEGEAKGQGGAVAGAARGAWRGGATGGSGRGVAEGWRHRKRGLSTQASVWGGG